VLCDRRRPVFIYPPGGSPAQIMAAALGGPAPRRFASGDLVIQANPAVSVDTGPDRQSTHVQRAAALLAATPASVRAILGVGNKRVTSRKRGALRSGRT
jgi:hypothetical protein